MQLSDSDREQLFARLRDHAGGGVLDVGELERRVEIVARAQTREQALIALEDLPPLPGEAGPRPTRPRWRQGHGDAEAPEADWRPTAERFRDPRTGRVMRVWEDSGGNRHYVPD